MSESALAPWSITEVAPAQFAARAVRCAANLLKAGVLLESGRPRVLPDGWKEKLQSDSAHLEHRVAELRAKILAAGGRPRLLEASIEGETKEEAEEDTAAIKPPARLRHTTSDCAAATSAPVCIGVAAKRRLAPSTGVTDPGQLISDEEWQLAASLLFAADGEPFGHDRGEAGQGVQAAQPKGVSLGVRKVSKATSTAAADGASGGASCGGTVGSAVDDESDAMMKLHVPPPQPLPGIEPALLPLPQLRPRCGRAMTASAGGDDAHDHDEHAAARVEPPLEQQQSDSPSHCAVAVTELPLSGGYAIGAGLRLRPHASVVQPPHSHGQSLAGAETLWPPSPSRKDALHSSSAAVPAHQHASRPAQPAQPLRRVHWRGLGRGGIPYRGAAPVQAQLAAAGVPPALLLQLHLRGLRLHLGDARVARNG